jgi:AcrR family transcriptional regulator
MSPAQIPERNEASHDVLRDRIIQAASELFLDHGYSKVSTSEIAAHIGISKKTLYREFETKEDILRAASISKMREKGKQVDAILAKRSLSFPEKLQAVIQAIGQQQQRVSPVLLRDICSSAPDIWKEIVEHKLARMKKFEGLLSEGVDLGYFRSDIPREIVVRMHAAAIESLTTPQALQDLPCTSEEVFQNIVRVLFEGIILEGKRKPFLNPSEQKKKRPRAPRATAHRTAARRIAAH